MPQLDPEFFISQLFWLFIFFSFLLIFLWRVSLPRIANVLEKRQDKIDDDLSSAKELQEKAKNIEIKINQQINDAKLETDRQLKLTISSLEENVLSKLTLLDKELDEKISKSEIEILKNKNDQLSNIKNEILNITKVTVSKITKLNLSDSDIDQAIKTYKGSLN